MPTRIAIMTEFDANQEQKRTAAGNPWPWVIAMLLFVLGALWLIFGPETGSTKPGANTTSLLPTIVPMVEPLEIKPADGLTPVSKLPGDPAALAGCNLLLVTLDTTRTDRIGCYGNAGISTPAIDGLAASGVMFLDAVAPAPTTSPSHASILTGLNPQNHGVHANGLYHISQESRTLAQVLQSKGFATGAAVSAFVLAARFGFDRGFGYYDADVAGSGRSSAAEIPERRGDLTVDHAITWLKDKKDERFFLWVHLFDAHAPYAPPPPFDAEYSKMPYDGEIAFADQQLGRLLAVLEEMGVSENTLVVVAGDHGEGLGQHSEPRHGYLLYESTLRVPLVMACGQRLGQGVYIERRVSLVDIMPTVLSLLGVDATIDFDGVDLSTATTEPRTILVETLHGKMAHGWAPLFAAYQDQYKYIHSPDPELYDLDSDPNEQVNLVDDRPELAQKLSSRLSVALGDDLLLAGQAEPTQQLSAQDTARLESLGYVGLSSASGASPVGAQDPKKMLPLKYEVELIKAKAGTQAGLQEAAVRLNQFITRHPDFEPAYSTLGECYFKAQAYGYAESAYRKANELRPNMSHNLLALAKIKTLQRDMDTAIALYRQLLSLYPDHAQALQDLGAVFLHQDRAGEAIEPLSKLLDQAPTLGTGLDLLLQACTKAQRPDRAVEILFARLQRDPELIALRDRLARLLYDLNDYSAAIHLLQEGLQLSPGRGELANNLALILLNCPDKSLRDPAEALRQIQAASKRSGSPNPRFLLIQSMAEDALGDTEQAFQTAQRAEELARARGQSDLAKVVADHIRSLGHTGRAGTTSTTQPQSSP